MHNKLLTRNDKLIIIELVENGKTLFVNGGIDKWVEDNKVMGAVYSDTGSYYRTWFRGLYYECEEYWKEAISFHSKVKLQFENEKLKKYDD